MSEPRLSVFAAPHSAQVVQAIFEMHFPHAARVIDLTFGKGRFWAWEHPFKVFGVDVDPLFLDVGGWDGKRTSFEDNSLDVAVIDPPFMHGATTSDLANRGHYKSRVGMNGDYSRITDQWSILKVYVACLLEARRLAPAVIVKCKDTIEASKYVDNARRVATCVERAGFVLIDKVVMVPPQKLPEDPKWGKQQHFRRQESYFLVGRRRDPSRRQNGR